MIKFQILKTLTWALLAVDRTKGRSTEQSTDVHREYAQVWLEGRSTGRSTDPEILLSGSGPDRPAVDRSRKQCSLVLTSVDQPVDRQVKTWVWSTEWSTGNPNGH